MSVRKLAACVTGWHYGRDLYEGLVRQPDLDVYVVSHRPAHEVPAYVYDLVGTARVLNEPNYGYDWGCFQQFLVRAPWRGYECVFFLHDDITIKEYGFIDHALALLGAGHSVIGNGRVGEHQPWPALTPEVYAHASWKPSPDFRHQVVRGSFMAASRAALEALGCFEVFWDRWRISSGFGNWSLKATCAKWEDRLGEQCFAFLSDEYLTSPYIDEMVRGGEGRRRTWRGELLKSAILRDLSAYYMAVYWRRRARSFRAPTLRLLAAILDRASGAASNCAPPV